MPALTTVLLATATAAAVGGSVYQAHEAVMAAKDQESALLDQARAEEAAAQQQADIERKAGAAEAMSLRERGKRLLASQRAALAKSGVKVDAGSGDLLQQETKRLTEQDALAAIRNSGDSYRLLTDSGKANADMLRKEAGRVKKSSKGIGIAAGIDSIGTVASAGSKMPKANRYSLLN